MYKQQIMPIELAIKNFKTVLEPKKLYEIV